MMVLRFFVPLVVFVGLSSCAGTERPRDAPLTTRVHARVVEPCGRALLEFDDGRLVAVEGDSPSSRLRLHVYRTPLVVDVVETGVVSDDDHCGAYPRVKVVSFAPDGPVQRVFSAGALDGAYHVYVENLPRDRFVPEDFEDGPELPLLDADRCRPTFATNACEGRDVRQTNADGVSLCCPFFG